ncbi:TIPIN [Symbiodinium sp. CCMP2592]|nr:TIPIN [Symbiodinium sp. CCMP2592]
MATISAGRGPSVHGGMLGLTEDIDMEDVKEEAVQPPSKTKKPKLTLEHFFQEAGLKKVIGDCAKLEFKGEGHEFEDLKVLMAAYKKWFREIYPYEDNFEDLIWKSRTVLAQKEPDCDPREELHKLRLWYKKSSSQASELKNEEVSSLDPEVAKRVAENRARALERKRQREAAVEQAQEEAMAAQAAQAQAEPDFEEEDVFGFGGME